MLEVTIARTILSCWEWRVTGIPSGPVVSAERMDDLTVFLGMLLTMDGCESLSLDVVARTPLRHHGVKKGAEVKCAPGDTHGLSFGAILL